MHPSGPMFLGIETEGSYVQHPASAEGDLIGVALQAPPADVGPGDAHAWVGRTAGIWLVVERHRLAVVSAYRTDTVNASTGEQLAASEVRAMDPAAFDRVARGLVAFAALQWGGPWSLYAPDSHSFGTVDETGGVTFPDEQ